jgi:hypothetical protein
MVEIVRVVLGIVLAGAALAKLASPRASIAAMESFGFAGGPLRPLAWAGLIALELALAVAVVLGSDTAAFAAAGLMLLFAALTAGAILRGRAGAPCACFGPRSKISWLSVLRNLGLAAGFAAIPPLESASLGTTAWLGIGVGVALLACAGLAVGLLGLAREVGMLRLQLGTQGALEIPGEGPPVGSRAEQLGARLAAGFADDRTGLGLAVFTSEGCHLCQTLSPAIESVANDPYVTVGVFDEAADADLWRSLQIPGSPFAIAIGRDGVVLAKGTFNNLAQLESVLATAERRRVEGFPDDSGDSIGGRLGRLPIGA